MTARILNLKEQVEESLHDPSKPWTATLESLESKLGVKRIFIFIGVITAVGLWLVYGFASQLVCNFIIFLYPAYMSINGIESGSKDEGMKWLTYWVVFAIFTLVEHFADSIQRWFPLFWLTKCIFFCWLMIPAEFNGSQIIYKKLIRPYFLKHHRAIDKSIE